MKFIWLRGNIGSLQKQTGIMLFAVCFSSCDLHDEAWPPLSRVWETAGCSVLAIQRTFAAWRLKCAQATSFTARCRKCPRWSRRFKNMWRKCFETSSGSRTPATQSLWFLQRQTTWTRLFPWPKAWDDDYVVAIETVWTTKYCQWNIHDKVFQQMFHDQRGDVVNPKWVF